MEAGHAQAVIRISPTDPSDRSMSTCWQCATDRISRVQRVDRSPLAPQAEPHEQNRKRKTHTAHVGQTGTAVHKQESTTVSDGSTRIQKNRADRADIQSLQSLIPSPLNATPPIIVLFILFSGTYEPASCAGQAQISPSLASLEMSSSMELG
jgi:hypothetical protein